MRKRTQLPRTSRVNEKIIEYYMKFGQERDLEKYMRLYSPNGQRSDCRSHSSATTNSSCPSADEGRVFRRLFQQHEQVELSTESDTDARELIVTIERQAEKMSMKQKGDEVTSSAPDLHTPPAKSKRPTDTKQTQTPESIAKSHRRLEWDSLGDVGYRKSLSTSNISILERSVLKEYFQEFSTTTSRKKEFAEVDSETNKLNSKSEERKDAHKLKKPAKEPTANNSTPPLASSTMMDKAEEKENIPTGSRPKLVSRSTSMSLQRRYDQCAQTSIQRLPQLTSREVQVALSSATSVTSSNAAGTATPSSFDYYSSRSTNSTTDGEAGVRKLSTKKGRTNFIKEKDVQTQVHPFVAGLNEMFQKHKAINAMQGKSDSIEIDKTASLQQVHNTLQQVFNDNKENTSSTSTMLNSPQLDLGIQLLCSLIDARSLSQRQKKKLVRDIVKRITTLGAEDGDDVGPGELEACIDNVLSASATPRLEQRKEEASTKSTSTVKVARAAKDSMDMSDLARDLPSSSNSLEHLVQVDVFQKPSLPTTSANAAAKLAEEKVKKSRNLNTKQKQTGTLENNKDNIKQQMENLEALGETQQKELMKLDNNTDKDSSASKASTTSKEVTTQKALHTNLEIAGTSDTASDIAAHSTMREWLNPMTQSEIEYEEKKLEYARNTNKVDKIKQCIDEENFDTERKTQLKWIQTEIERLQMLRCLLLKTNTERAKEGKTEAKIVTDLDVNEIENLYDTVFTEPQRGSITTTTTTISSAQSSCAEGGKPVQEIEVIIEESNEDVIELDERIKRSKQRKRETQIVYDKTDGGGNEYDNLAAGRARFRTMTEVVTTNEEQILPIENATNSSSSSQAPPPPVAPAKQSPTDLNPPLPQQPRLKMDTPSTESNDGAESVGSFAKQRKREFLEQYRHKKRMHYESLLHQQQQLLIQQQQHIIQELQQRCNAITHNNNARTGVEHYSLPLNIPNAGFCGCRTQQQQQQPYHQTYFQQPCVDMRARGPQLNRQGPPREVYERPYPPHQARATYPPHQANSAHPQNHGRASRIPQSHTVAATLTTETIHSEQSTSSIFCISSEVSIPMGSTSTSTSSTTTTTHQYDDVAATVCRTIPGVGVQTGASLQRTQPIFGRRVLYDCAQGRNMPVFATYNPQPIGSGQSISVQVKPKSIAYVIQFDKKTTTSTTTISTSTTTSTASNSTLSKIENGNELNNMRDADPQEPCALQDYLERAKPKFVAQTKERKAILNQIQALRLERGKELREIIENASENSLDTRLQRLPPPATKRLRIFATKEMKAMTQRHFVNLPEVVEQKERAREERRRHGNRMIRDIFNQRLQRRVRTGKLSLNHSKTVI